jgi:lipoate-protein ligase A
LTRWRLLETGAKPGAWNMACDAALLATAEREGMAPTLRFFGWDPPAVSLGHNQPDPSAAEAAMLRARGVDWVRRPTGGRAVYHAGPGAELTYSLVAPIAAPGLGGGLTDAYRRIHEAIAAGLERLGASVEFAPRRPRRDPREPTGSIRPTSRRACFAATVPWEIEVEGRKLVGSAQRRCRRALLQHGSIPLAGDQALLNETWPGSLEPGRTTTVSSAVGRAVAFGEVATILAESFANSLTVELELGRISNAELRAIDALLPSPALA